MQPDALRRRREALNLTQAQLAEALGLKQPHIARWETGAIKITHMRALWLNRELTRLEATRSATTDA